LARPDIAENCRRSNATIRPLITVPKLYGGGGSGVAIENEFFGSDDAALVANAQR